MAGIENIGTIKILRSQQERWRSGGLVSDWARRFPDLFDEDDVRLVKSQGRYGWHFVEWVAAILLYHRTGYHSLVCKYEFANHARKVEIRDKVLPAAVLTTLFDRTEHGPAQGPDLLMYARDFSHWFFCEVKGEGDELGPDQVRKFEALATASLRPVRLLRLSWAPAVDRLFHIGRSRAWEEAQREGAYGVSTSDRRLVDEGFIHLAFAHQVKVVADAVHRGRNDLVLLDIDPAKLNCPVLIEDLDGSGNWFPHAYGELNLDAINDAPAFSPNQDGTFPDMAGPST